ncbi:MAG: hypothetical protein ACLTC8_03565 [Lachnospiraceae bacterium]
MDRITHDIRRSNWLEILNRSQQRPVHTTIKQWCLDNGISEKSYYYWQLEVPSGSSRTGFCSICYRFCACYICRDSVRIQG